MKFLSLIKNLEKRRVHFFLILFFISLLFRLPTLFNDYYDVDELAAIVQVYEYLAGNIPGEDFDESKLPLYHAIFKLSYSLSYDKGFVIVHLFTIFIIFSTSIYIFLIGVKLQDFHTGVLGAILYAILISSFNRHFMATNGEIVYNLPITAGLYYFIMYLSNRKWKRILFLLLFMVMGFAAAYVKIHGLIFFIFIALYTIVYYPYLTKRVNTKYILMVISIGLLLLIISIYLIDYSSITTHTQKIIAYLKTWIFYSTVRGFDPFIFIIKYAHRQGMLLLWHCVLWIPAIIYIIRFFNNRFKSDTPYESAVSLLFILSFLMVFSGGIRLYFHYFIAIYPSLCILSSIALIKYKTRMICCLKQRLTPLILIPSLFFLLWNTKDIIIKHYFPIGFYKEGKILYWTRTVLIGSFNDYLLPDSTYMEACNYIKEVTQPEDKIFVWGDGPYLYYFSERRMGGKSLWLKNMIIHISNLYISGDPHSIDLARIFEEYFINIIETKKPVLFIDTSENGLSNFHLKPEALPLINKYIKKNYYYLNNINNIKIYRLKGN
ncbi:MAG: hypothetical protein SVZ03_12510 [Spirochaetota bacterium]|nr:hypothetical protein [Spirochaetota bacterium]